jgi:hypothetical protein
VKDDHFEGDEQTQKAPKGHVTAPFGRHVEHIQDRTRNRPLCRLRGHMSLGRSPCLSGRRPRVQVPSLPPVRARARHSIRMGRLHPRGPVGSDGCPKIRLQHICRNWVSMVPLRSLCRWLGLSEARCCETVPNQTDQGVYQLTKDEMDKMAFKVPWLRKAKMEWILFAISKGCTRGATTMFTSWQRAFVASNISCIRLL